MVFEVNFLKFFNVIDSICIIINILYVFYRLGVVASGRVSDGGGVRASLWPAQSRGRPRSTPPQWRFAQIMSVSLGLFYKGQSCLLNTL